jgi:hypothetical protein
MGLGETLGFGTRLTQNNGGNGLYQNEINPAAGQIHIALMGDPTLRLHVVAPPTQLNAVTTGNAVNLNWTASTDPVLGYHVYRASSANTAFVRLTTSPVNGNSYIDATGGGAGRYMVRAVTLQTSPSGSYYNPSVGAFAMVSNSGSPRPPILISASRASNGIRLTWSTQAGLVYHVQARDAAQPGTWSDISGSITASDSTTTWTDTNALSVPERLYRIVGT